MAVTPVEMVGSGSGAKIEECKVGKGCPAALALLITVGLIDPMRNMKTGILCFVVP